MKPVIIARQFKTRLDTCPTVAFVGLVLFVFVCFSLISMLNHELWRDELQAWELATQSSSIMELLHNAYYEAHPPLWWLILMILARIRDQLVIMQATHLVIAVAVAFVILRFAPFSRAQKILLIFGYFFIFEYNVISRNYAIGILLMFSFCALFRPGSSKSYPALASILSLLAQTSVYGLIVSICMGSTMVVECIVDGTVLRTLAQRKWAVLFSATIFLVSVTICILWILPPSDTGVAMDWRTELREARLKKTLSTTWKSYFPIPAATYHFWNSNIVSDKTLGAFLGAVLLLCAGMWFVRKVPPLFLFLTGSFGILAFGYVKYSGFLRHHGHLFIILVMCLWLYECFPDRAGGRRFLDKIQAFSHRYRNPLFGAMLAVHCAVGAYACMMDWTLPFSASEEAARYIRANHLENMPMLGHNDVAASAIAMRLDREIYYPRGERFGRFILFDMKRRVHLSDDEVFARANRLARRSKTDVLLVLNYDLEEPGEEVTELRQFNESIVEDETYHLYLFHNRNQTTPQP